MRTRIPKYYAKSDKNQPEIVEALRDAGVWVYIISSPVDLLWIYQGKVGLMEVKMPGKKLNKRQILLSALLARFDYELPVAHSVDEALEIVGADQDAAA